MFYIFGRLGLMVKLKVYVEYWIIITYSLRAMQRNKYPEIMTTTAIDDSFLEVPGIHDNP